MPVEDIESTGHYTGLEAGLEVVVGFGLVAGFGLVVVVALVAADALKPGTIAAAAESGSSRLQHQHWQSLAVFLVKGLHYYFVELPWRVDIETEQVVVVVAAGR